MKNLLYIGNKLNLESANVTTIDTLGLNLEKEGYKVSFSSSKITKVIRLLDMVLATIKNARQTHFVLIDTYSTQNFYYAFVISQLCRVLKLKYIPILHGGDLPKRLQTSKRMSDYIFNNAYKIVSPSLYLKEIFENFGYIKITFIPNSIEITNYPFKDKRIDKPKIFWLRSFKKIYNPLMAIKVAKNLKNKNIGYELCMVGPDGDGSFLFAQNLARELGVEVTFKMKMDKSDWIKESFNYNVFINTSNFDNMPVSVIEAMALGFPIVSTNVGGMSFMIEDNVDGLLVNKDDETGMTSAIIQLINNPNKTEKMINIARKKAEKFDWNNVKHKWFELLS